MLDNVIIIGAGFSGLINACAIAPYCREIVIVESGELPLSTPQHRKGVPQDRHIHTLLQKGRLILQELIPNFETHLDELGVPETDYIEDCQLFTHLGKLPRFASNVKIRPCSRPVLDWVVLEHVKTLKNVRIIEQTRVNGLVIKNEQVEGINFEQDKTQGNHELLANLVIDCSGRHSKMPKWLNQTGIESPKLSRVNPHLGYASCLYENIKLEKDCKAIEVACHSPHNPRAAGLWQIENNKWLLTLIGTAKEYPPSDDKGFLEFAKNLNTDAVHNAIKDTQAISPIRSHRGTENQWFHYEKMTSLPNGLIITGDAHCCFNPYYGHGMSIIAMSAKTLAHTVKNATQHSTQNKHELTQVIRKKYYKKTRKHILLGWTMATFEDARWPTTQGLSSKWYEHLFFKYLDAVVKAAISNELVARKCIEISNMTTGVEQIMHPAVVLAVIKNVFLIKRQGAYVA